MSEQLRHVDVIERRNRRIALVFTGVAFSMLGLAYAAVPLYRMFCQVTGYDGTPRRAIAPSANVLDRKITIRFDSNINDLAWQFEPAQRKMTVRIGENALAFYRATNTSDRVLTGSATFNVAPEITASFFNKVACFCFTQQTLQPGETKDMPVSFFVDPAIVKDMDARDVSEITLSYTFYPVETPPGKAAAVQGVGGATKPSGSGG